MENEILRHFLSTLVYRGEKAILEIPMNYGTKILTNSVTILIIMEYHMDL
ncbi:MAG: hypothetical protein JWM44_2965 [Bacilli bacterium]|nr:hypothetical protein [Bacilli bacterium]